MATHLLDEIPDEELAALVPHGVRFWRLSAASATYPQDTLEWFEDGEWTNEDELVRQQPVKFSKVHYNCSLPPEWWTGGPLPSVPWPDQPDTIRLVWFYRLLARLLARGFGQTAGRACPPCRGRPVLHRGVQSARPHRRQIQRRSGRNSMTISASSRGALRRPVTRSRTPEFWRRSGGALEPRSRRAGSRSRQSNRCPISCLRQLSTIPSPPYVRARDLSLRPTCRCPQGRPDRACVNPRDEDRLFRRPRDAPGGVGDPVLRHRRFARLAA